MNLVIVESPTKAHTIESFLGSDFSVTASIGHIKDLPPKSLGVKLDQDFAPDYQILPGKRKVIEAIRKAAEKAERVYIATDPDREGEAIAAHVAEVIQKIHPHPYRVLFHEITRTAVQQAIKTPGNIDFRKVDAQVARRVVDRLVGYQVSPFIWKTVAGGLSAGRVQSVALRLICEREQEVRDFVPREYWTLRAQFYGQAVEPFWADLVAVEGKKPVIPDETAATALVTKAKIQTYQLAKFERSKSLSKPPAPYITSTLQQDAGRRLGMSSKRIMALAQALYEGQKLPSGETVGLITYMRTDSMRISGEAQTACKHFIENTFGKNFAALKPRIYKAKKLAQDAHEAIRPTDVHRTPEDLKGVLEAPLWKLYDLIWRRFVASQMTEAVFDVTTVEVAGEGLLFRARWMQLHFPGFLKVYPFDSEKDNPPPALPADFSLGYPLSLKDTESQQHFTQPPARFTEATLVKTLDELGIGRPSTYASIVSTLFDRNYVKRDERKLLPTPMGETVNKILVNLFPDIFETSFTARMEAQLDQVEEGTPWVQVVREFYEPFAQSLKIAESKRKSIKEKVQEVSSEICEKCGSPMVVKWSRRGQFLACSAFPKCKNARPLETPPPTGRTCSDCGGELLVKTGRYGRFLGCSNYPQCKHIEPVTSGVKCPMPDCDGELVERQTRKGRFYSCSKYPQCHYRLRTRPEPVACPECGNPFMVHASKSEEDGQLSCPKCKATVDLKKPTEEVVAE